MSQQYDPRYGAEPLKHSGLGIASLAIAIVMGLVEFILIAIAGVKIAAIAGVGGWREAAPQFVLLGLGLLFSMFLTFIGGVLGIVGVAMPGRNKLFAWLGLGFNGMLVLGMLGLMCLGLALG